MYKDNINVLEKKGASAPFLFRIWSWNYTTFVFKEISMLLEHDIANLKFNIYRIRDFEISVVPRLFDFSICVSDSNSRKYNEYTIVYPVHSSDLSRMYSVLYYLLSENRTLVLADLVFVSGCSSNTTSLEEFIRSFLVTPTLIIPPIKIAGYKEIAAIIDSTNQVDMAAHN